MCFFFSFSQFPRLLDGALNVPCLLYVKFNKFLLVQVDFLPAEMLISSSVAPDDLPGKNGKDVLFNTHTHTLHD